MINSASDEAKSSGNTSMIEAATSGQTVITPIFIIFGLCITLAAAYGIINALGRM